MEALNKIDDLAYRFWSVHPRELDEWIKDAPAMPNGYKGGARTWFFACEMRKLFAPSPSPPPAAQPGVVKALKAIAEGYPVRGEHDRYVVVENPDFRPDDGSDPNICIDTFALAAPVAQEPVANWSGWRSIDTAPEDCRVLLATAGNWVGEAIMLRDEDTGKQVWSWVDTGKPSLHSCYGWMHLPEHLSAPVLSDLRPDGFDGPTGAE